MNAVEWPHLVAEHLLKSALVLALGFGLVALLRRSAPAGKHGVWQCLFAAGLAIPLLLMLPRWEVLPSWMERSAPVTAEVAAETTVWPPAMLPADDLSPFLPSGTHAPLTTPQKKAFPISEFFLGLWAMGMLALLLQFVAVSAFLRRLERKARMPGPRLRAHFDRIRSDVAADRAVTLLLSPSVRSPFVWGLARSRILLPESAERWSDADLEMVLIHELEHVRRGDARAVLTSRLFLALNWINPLAWIAHRQSVRFREEACDEEVVSRGHDSRDYADLLLRQARSASAPVLFSCATSVVETGTVEGRVRRVLNSGGDRSDAPGRSTLARWVALFAVAATFAIGMLGWRTVGAEDGNKEIEDQPGDDLVLITYPAPASVFATIAEGQRSAQEALENAGVTFGEGARAMYNPIGAQLVVRITHDQMGLLEAFMEAAYKKAATKFPKHPVSEEAALKEMDDKLKSIFIPVIDFKELPLRDALVFIQEESVKHDTITEDPDKRGINIILDAREHGEKVQRAAITLRLRSVPLAEALRYTASLAGMEYIVAPHAILVIPIE